VRVGRAASAASASVPPAAAQAATAEGARLTVEETIAYALHNTLPDRASTSGSPLTEREQDVAELVAHGYTNAQIAARLFISNRTVATHLTHIRAKLGLPSRIHIAAWINSQKPAGSR
jgi:DNA-binding NarL/FixJ family response regulator